MGEYPRLLQGIADHHNQQKGFDMQAPIAVGDWSKAAQVYTRGIAEFSAVPLKRISPKAIQALLGNQLEDKNEND
nr:DUF6475 domain-containing protein [Vibrio vulnificus]